MNNRRLLQGLSILATLLIIGSVSCAAPPADGDGLTARKEKIQANLTLRFPKLENMNVSITELGPSKFAGVDEGTLTADKQHLKFLVSNDDTVLYLVNGEPLDVSKTLSQVKVELQARAEERAKHTRAVRKEIDDSNAGLPVRGNPQGPVTIAEFADFECPFCARGAITVKQILAKYPNDVKFVYKYFPLGFHPWARAAAMAAYCASQQSDEAFWKLHDMYFDHQKELTPENLMDKSEAFLSGSGIALDIQRWETCAADKESDGYKMAAKAIEADMKLGTSLGVNGTPGFFINGRFLSGAQPLSSFEPLIAEAKKDPAP